MSTLHNCGRLEVRNSPIEGFGVFATDKISKGEVLEEIPFVLFPRYTALGKVVFDAIANNGFLSPKEKYYEHFRVTQKFKEPEKYYFKWIPENANLDGDTISYFCLPLGNGPIYNTSNTDNNASWRITEKTFIFTAERDIEKDEEIKTYYGYLLSENGTIFNADTVFFLAFDKDKNGTTALRSVRFSSPQHLGLGKREPAYFKLMNHLKNAEGNNLYVSALSVILPNGEEKFKTDFVQAQSSILDYFRKLTEFKQMNAPFVKVYYSFTDSTKVVDGTTVTTAVVDDFVVIKNQ